MAILLDGTGGVTTPGVVNTAGETIATTLSVTGATNLAVSSGNVGIGTASPTKKLQVVTDTAQDGILIRGSTNPRLQVIDTTNSVTLEMISGDSIATIRTDTNHDLSFGTNGTEQARITAAGLFQFNSGYGSAATAYGCRAWVNFNGTGTVSIRASGNVSSITDQGVGQYAVNFTTAMPDANYASVGNSGPNTTTNSADTVCSANTTSSFDVRHFESNAATDVLILNASIFR